MILWLPQLRCIAAIATLLVTVTTTGCWQATYLVGLAKGQAHVLRNTQTLQEAIEDKRTHPDVRRNLQELGQVLDFADQYGFETDGQYQTVAQGATEAAVWVVVAADIEQPKQMTWWFPIAGTVPYLGFFERADAEARRDALIERGKEAIVRPARAYSTLGWFGDPLFSSLAVIDRLSFIETVLHELFHATAYVPDHSDWNESAARYTAQQATQVYLQKHAPDQLQAYAGAISDSDAFMRMMLDTHAALVGDFERDGLTNYMQHKQKWFEQLKHDLRSHRWHNERYRLWADADWNHARLFALLPYAAQFERFAARWETEGGQLHKWMVLMQACADQDDPWACVGPDDAAAAIDPQPQTITDTTTQP